ncbi:MAG: ABC transporter permease [Bacilli bacterium]|jgi:ABC-2 type transport system permease protein|nr:ABC transporter permease [Acholeplasmataceae bacterium]
MTVFRLYWRIFWKNSVIALIYFMVFIVLGLIQVQNYPEDEFSFSIVKTKIVFVDRDNTEITQGLKSYLEKYAIYKDIEEGKIEEALFYNEIELYVEIPEGFTEALKEGEILPIGIKTGSQAPRAHIITRTIQKYSHLAYVHINNGQDSEALVSKLRDLLDREAVVSEVGRAGADLSESVYYFNYMAYLLLALIISVISVIMLAFKPLEIKRRNLLSSISNRKMNLILLFCNFLLGIGFLLALLVLGIILYPRQVLTGSGFLLMLNAFIFIFPVMALSYLVVTLFDSKNVITACGVVFSLGFSFITGVFIPQFLLDEKILLIAKFIPSYYYVANNNKINEIANLNFQNLRPVLTNFLIQLGFALLFILITVYVAKKRETQEN